MVQVVTIDFKGVKEESSNIVILLLVSKVYTAGSRNQTGPDVPQVFPL